MEGVPGTLYEGEKFVLQFKFTNKYPFDSPEVSLNLNLIFYLRKLKVIGLNALFSRMYV